MQKSKLIVCMLLVCISFAGVAEAKSRGGSFKSGFSSQKRNVTKTAPAYSVPANEQSKKTAFGSFSTTNAKNQNAAANVSQSQMSKDLTDTTAQSNALKMADARNKLNDTATTSENGWFRSGSQNTASQNTAGAQTKPSSTQTFERRNGGQQTNNGQNSGLLHGLMWFMVGNSLAQHATAANSQSFNQAQINGHDANREINQGSQENINGETSSMNADGIAAQRVQDVPAEETESVFAKILRFLLWIVLISGIIWVVRRVTGSRHRGEKKPVNYSLGS